MQGLEPLVGEWDVTSSLAPGTGRMTLDWTLGGRFLVQRSGFPLPEFPDAMSLIAPDGDGPGYRQHYFDSRGVVRLYAMTFDGRVWTLARDAADFSPLPFAQRYEGTLSDDGRVIEGRWERTGEDGAWTTDFEITYTRR